MKILAAFILLLGVTASVIARDIYGYIGFGYGISPIVGCSVHLTGPGVDRWTRASWNPLGLFKLRYYFNGVPTGRSYNVTVYPDALYSTAGVSFYLPWGIFDCKVPDIWVR